MDRIQQKGAAAGDVPTLAFTTTGSGVDIARPDLVRKRLRRRWILGVSGSAALTLVTVFLARLEPAAPRLSTEPWIGTVTRGEMRREVRGNGTLVPEPIRFVQAETAGTVVGALVGRGLEGHSGKEGEDHGFNESKERWCNAVGGGPVDAS